jgi:hypothetical protein
VVVVAVLVVLEVTQVLVEAEVEELVLLRILMQMQ